MEGKSYRRLRTARERHRRRGLALIVAGLVLYGPSFLFTVLGLYGLGNGLSSGGFATFATLWAASIVMIAAGVSYVGH